MDKEELRQRNEKFKLEKERKEQELRDKGKILNQKAEKMVKKRNATPFWTKWGDPIGYAAIGLVVVGLIVLNYTGDKRKLGDILVNDEAYIQTHNEDKGHGFSLEKNEYFQGASLQTIRDYAKNNLAAKKSMTKCSMNDYSEILLPDDYNFYKAHYECRFDDVQKKCSAGYVDVPLSVFRNRECKADPTVKFEPSTDFFLHCNTKINKGCKGGFLLSTLNYMRKNGFISKECWEQHNPKDAKEGSKDAKEECPIEKLKSCERKMLDSYCHFEGLSNIKREIIENGPVISLIQPYKDFLVYKKGTYTMEDRAKVDGLFFVKIVGWETDTDKREYWLVDPMWGRAWGEDGLARVKVGSEESNIEKYAFTLYPNKAENGSTKKRAVIEAYLEDD